MDVSPCPHSSSSLWWPLFHFLPQWASLVYILYMSAIMWYLTFRVWCISFEVISSQSIHVVTDESIMFFFKLTNKYSIIFMYCVCFVYISIYNFVKQVSRKRFVQGGWFKNSSRKKSSSSISLPFDFLFQFQIFHVT